MLLQLLTQRRAIEKKPSNKIVLLCRVLRKEGVLSDPEKLMDKAQQVRSLLKRVEGIIKHNCELFGIGTIESNMELFYSKTWNSFSVLFFGTLQCLGYI